jgi:hypothetical protein
MNRYIEKKDKNEKPIFEGDELILTIKDKDFGGSYIGNLCKSFDVDKIKIKILNNDKKLQVKYNLSYFKDNNKIITVQEEKHWSHVIDCKEDSSLVEQSFDSFINIDNAKEYYESNTMDSLFFSYLCKKGLEKISGIIGEPVLENDNNLEIPVTSENLIYVNDKVTFLLVGEMKDKLSRHIDSDEKLKIGEYTNITFEFLRIENNFNYKIHVTYTDSNGNCLIKKAKLNYEAERINSEYSNKLSRIMIKQNKADTKELEEERESVENKMLSLYDDESNLEYLDFKPYFGFQAEIKVFNFLIKNNCTYEILK